MGNSISKGQHINKAPRSARVISVIETTALTGAGTEESPIKRTKQYWDFDGKLLANGNDYLPISDVQPLSPN